MKHRKTIKFAMSIAEINTSDLDLWKVAYSIRGLVENRSYYYGANPLPDDDETTLVSAVEQIFLTEGMMLSFLRGDEPEGLFATSLRKWGVVQSMVVQQDAVDFLASILQEPKLNFNEHSELRVIRDDLRNRYVGHPVRDRQSSKFVVTAVSDKENEASYIELGEKGMGVRRFDLEGAIETQLKILKGFLSNLKTKNMEKEEEFRKSARAALPLDVVRKSTFPYHLSKTRPQVGGTHLYNAKELAKQLPIFRSAFAKVGGLSRVILEDLNTMDYAARQVVDFYGSKEDERRLVAEDVSIFISSLDSYYKLLIKYADEIEGDISETSC